MIKTQAVYKKTTKKKTSKNKRSKEVNNILDLPHTFIRKGIVNICEVFKEIYKILSVNGSLVKTFL